MYICIYICMLDSMRNICMNLSTWIFAWTASIKVFGLDFNEVYSYPIYIRIYTYIRMYMYTRIYVSYLCVYVERERERLA